MLKITVILTDFCFNNINLSEIHGIDYNEDLLEKGNKSHQYLLKIQVRILTLRKQT